jgi:hypothetical protein
LNRSVFAKFPPSSPATVASGSYLVFTQHATLIPAPAPPAASRRASEASHAMHLKTRLVWPHERNGSAAGSAPRSGRGGRSWTQTDWRRGDRRAVLFSRFLVERLKRNKTRALPARWLPCKCRQFRTRPASPLIPRPPLSRGAQNQLRRRLRQQMAFDESLPARKSRQQRKSPAGIDA